MKKVYPLSEVIEDIQQLVLSLSTQKAVARHLHISPQYLGDVLRGRREPGPALLKRLGWKKVVGYKQVPEGNGNANDIDG